MPAGQGSDPEARGAERLAAAVDQGRSPESVDDPALAHDLRVIELMRVFGPDPALTPAPDAKARARARLRAAMAELVRIGWFGLDGPAAQETTLSFADTWREAGRPLTVIASWTAIGFTLARRSMRWEPRV